MHTRTFTGRNLFDFGYLLEARRGAHFADLSPDEVIALFERHGALLFRGFSLEPSNVLDAVNLYSHTLLRMDAPRRRDALGTGGTSVLTDYPGLPIPLHSENSYFFQQYWPEIVWLYCERPPEHEGHTLLCDGALAWNELDPGLRKQFLEKRLVYRLCVPKELLEYGINADDGEGNIRAAVEHMARGTPGVRHWFDDARNLHAEVKRHGVTLGRDGRTWAFANHVCSYMEPAIEDEIRFEDGMPIAPRAMQQIRNATDRHTRKVEWVAGDLLMIDNHRVLHGRTAYDPACERRLISAMTLTANFAYGQSFRVAISRRSARNNHDRP
ncbi:TauD/TfdA family dioxygenase [Pendulispora albinea]|uniref:TauD/TfdA family dioxygenase n=1 Tax=Pendulispora albinea TaxID=2741071 RepID=A0ABZ2LY29_9BACT